MSVTVKENFGRVGNLSADGNASVSRSYTVLGATTEDAATSAVRSYLALTIGEDLTLYGLVLDTIASTEEVYGCWRSTATWKTFARRSPPAKGESQFSFELGLEPVKVRHAIGGIVVYKAEDAADWTPELLNDLGDGETPEGVDIFEPTYDESETHWGPTAAITPTYRNKLKSLVGKVNDRPWKGWDTGEVLLRGISGTRRGSDDSELTFRWSVRENLTGITIGGVTGVNKTGWQYLWPRAKVTQAVTVGEEESSEETSSSNLAVSQITHVCVATVFRSGNMWDLGIGG